MSGVVGRAGTSSGVLGDNAEIPVGTIMVVSFNASGTWFASNRFLFCNGQTVNRITYNDLFAEIGTAWGAGDGSSTFNVPDLRGQFLRGRNAGSGQDPDASSRTGGDAVGSSQGSRIENSTARSYSPYNSAHNDKYIYTTSTGSTWGAWASDVTIKPSSFSFGYGPLASGVVLTYVVGSGSDTRPKNKYVDYAIKF